MFKWRFYEVTKIFDVMFYARSEQSFRVRFLQKQRKAFNI